MEEWDESDEYFDCESEMSSNVSSEGIPDLPGATTSTPHPGPKKVGSLCDLSNVSVFRLSEEEEDGQFDFLGGTRNMRRTKCIIYSSDSDNNVIPEEAAVRWREKTVSVVKFVDDQTAAEKLDISNCIKMCIIGRNIGVKRAMGSERQFRTIERNAECIGMKVNTAKTQLLCVSAVRSFTPEPYIVGALGTRIECCESLKCLGFHFSNRSTARNHVACLLDKLRKRVWSLRHLRKSGFKQPELVKVYCAMIRPVAEYCSVVYHTLITAEESDRLDRFKAQCLKNIYGRKMSYRAMLKKAEITRLSERRQETFDKFAERAAHSDKFRKWFPVYHSRAGNNRKKLLYKEYHARTDRLYFSPLYVMRRRLNGRTKERIRSRARTFVTS